MTDKVSKQKSRMPNDEETKKWQKIPFRIVHVSSEDEEYSSRELINHTPFSRGWQSSRFCSYPQEILLEFPKLIRMREIQFLSHQYNIASKIEIYILPLGSDKLKKIGYLSLDSNERSNFQARELKTVYTDYQTTRVKFNLMRCHTNIHNIYAQVGLIAISIFGEYPNKTNDYTNNDKVESNFAKLEDEMIYDPATLKRLKDLYKAKYKAVEAEDFDEAKRIKVAIDSLKSVSQSLIQLEERKKIAIKNDDFDAAKLIKHEIDRLRNAVAGANINEINKKIAQEQKNNNKFNNMNNMNNNDYNDFNEDPNNQPQMKDKIYNKNNNMYDIKPITNEYEMDNDEDIYRIRNNINAGYQLQSPQDQEQYQNQIKKLKGKPNDDNYTNTGGVPTNNTNNFYNEGVSTNPNQLLQQNTIPSNNTNMSNNKKKVLDVDNLVVGVSKDFNQLLEEQLKDPNQYKEDKKDDGLNDISAQDYKIAEPLIPVLTYEVVKLIFSPQWKNKEDGFNTLTKEVKNYPNSTLFGNQQVENIMNACLGACAYALTSNISQALLASMELILILLNKFRTYKPDGYLKADFDKYSNTCIRLLIEHIGDQNIKLKEKAENTLAEFANYNLIGSKVLFEHIISGQIKKSLVNSSKHLIGRYNFLTRLIGNFGYNPNEVPLSTIMNYAVKGYTNPQNTVREAALQLIVSIYKFVGDKVRTYFKDLRPAQINTIEDALMSVDVGGNNNMNIQGNNMNDFNDNKEIINDSQMLNNEQQENYQKNQDYQPYNDRNPDDLSHTCEYCGLFDPNITSEEIEIHQFKECPMLIPCFMCNQIIEISDLNNHFLKDCSQRKQFKECPRCKEPVLIKDYQNHVADGACNQFTSPQLANRCPLCHNDITPAGKIGWEVHLLQQQCPNNPRTGAY